MDDSGTEQGLGAEENSVSEKPAPRLPLNRVKSIMRMDPDLQLVSNDAVFVLARATEMFIDAIAKEAYVFTAKGKRKTLSKKDLDNATNTLNCLLFLEGALDF